MVNIIPVSRERHSSKSWRRFDSFSFAGGIHAVPLTWLELDKAATGLPIGFVKDGGGRTAVVAVLSPVPGRNLFVGPDGKWYGGYVPAALRAYPFRAARRQGTESFMLCVDEDSGLVTSTGGEAFFDDGGNLSKLLQDVVNFLQQMESGRAALDLAAAALDEAGVIHPWELKIETDGKGTRVEGLYCVDRAALDALGDGAFLALRARGALMVAYTQLISMTQITLLTSLWQFQDRLAAQPTRKTPSLDEIFKPSDGGMLKFD